MMLACRPRSCSTPRPVYTEMGAGVGKLYRYMTSRPHQLSLAIPPWVAKMSIEEEESAMI